MHFPIIMTVVNEVINYEMHSDGTMTFLNDIAEQCQYCHWLTSIRFKVDYRFLPATNNMNGGIL